MEFIQNLYVFFQSADRGLVIHGEDGVDLGIGLQNISHGRLSIGSSEAVQLILGDVGLIIADLVQIGIEACLTQLADTAGRGHVQHNDVSGRADLIGDVLGGLVTHVLVIAGDLVDAGAVHINVKVDDGDTGIDDLLHGSLHAGPLGPRHDDGGAPGNQIVQRGSHLSSVGRGGDLVLQIVVLAVLLSVVSNAGNPAVSHVGSSNTDLNGLCGVLIVSSLIVVIGSIVAAAAGHQRQCHDQSQNES